MEEDIGKRREGDIGKRREEDIGKRREGDIGKRREEDIGKSSEDDQIQNLGQKKPNTFLCLVQRVRSWKVQYPPAGH